MSLKKLTALLISFIIVFSCSFISASAREIATETITVEEYRAYKANTATLMSVADDEVDTALLRECLFNAAYTGEGVADISQFGIYNIYTVSDLMWNSMPELLGSVGKISYSYYIDTGLIVSVIYIYRDNAPDFKTVYDEFEMAAQKMTADLKTDKLTDVQKALILHDRVIAKCEYDTAAADELVEFYAAHSDDSLAVPPWDEAHNGYGAIVTGNAICQGYTEAYEYLLEKVGIKSVRCSSTLLNHIWNILYINGKAYHVDVTWDDPVFEDEQGNFVQKPLDYIAHNNFLLSSMALYHNDHNSNGYYDYNFTPDDTTYDNYFWKNCHHETILIGGGLYHYNDNEELCEYNTTISLADSGLGDIDGDKKIDSVDISYCRKFLTDSAQVLDGQFEATDLTDDGKISVSDLVRLKKILLYV